MKRHMKGPIRNSSRQTQSYFTPEERAILDGVKQPPRKPPVKQPTLLDMETSWETIKGKFGDF